MIATEKACMRRIAISDMKPIDKLNELSPSASSNVDHESPSTVEINNDMMQVQLRINDSEVRQRELESRQAV